MRQNHYSKKRTLSRVLSILLILVITSLACNLPIFTSEPASPPAAEAPLPALEATPRIDPDRSSDTQDDAAITVEEPAEEAPAPADGSETSGPIPAADNPAIPDCNAFDLNAFNTIIEGAFSFVIQDQLNNCHFESDNGFRLMIGGGKPSSSEEIHALFEGSFGALPDSTWEAIDDYFLGLAYSSASVTAQGVSASGHSMVIVAASQPGSDPEALKMIFEKLAREAAQQLNMQF